MNNFSNHLEKVKLSGIRVIGDRASALAAQGRRVVRLQIGEPDFYTPRHIIDAAIASLGRCETHYASNRGLPELRAAIAQKLEKENRISHDPADEIVVVNGCAEALFCAVSGLVGAGEEVIVIEPAFLSYEQIALLAGAIPVIVRAKEQNGWLPEIADIEGAITPRTRMLILNTPVNPTGAVYPKELLAQIAELARRHDILVASDEVYEKLIYDAEHVSIGSFAGMQDRTITINGFSKAYAMTGWRLGYLAASRQLMLPMLKVHQYTTTCLPAFVQRGGLEALENGEDGLQQMRSTYLSRRDLLLEYFHRCDAISLVVPKATFYMYPNIAKSSLDSTAFCHRLLEERGVATVPDTAFDHAGRDNIRLSFASDEASLREGAEQICRLASGR
jgi:aminotransferase